MGVMTGAAFAMGNIVAAGIPHGQEFLLAAGTAYTVGRYGPEGLAYVGAGMMGYMAGQGSLDLASSVQKNSAPSTAEPRDAGDDPRIQLVAARLSARDRAYLDKYYDPVVAEAGAYMVDPAQVLGVGAESGFASEGTYLRTGDAFGQTGGSTENMTHANTPTENVKGWFRNWGRQVYGTRGNDDAFMNALQGRDVSGNRVAGWKAYNTQHPMAWRDLVSSGINQMRADIPIYQSLRVNIGGI